MSVNNFNVFAVDYTPETNFSVDPGSGYKSLRAEQRPSIKTEVEILGDTLRKYRLTRQKGVRGGKSGSFSLAVRVTGSGVAAGNSVATAASELSPLIMAAGLLPVFETHQEGSAVVAGGSGDKVNVVDGDGDNWAAGAGIVSENNELNFVKSVDSSDSPDEITCVQSWATQPQTSEEMFNTRSFYPSKNPIDLRELDTFTFRFHTSDFLLKLLGCCVADFSIKGDAGKLITATLEIKFNDFEFDEAAEPAALSDMPGGIKALGAPFYYDAVETPVAGFEFRLGNTVKQITDANSQNGRSGWFVSDRKSVLKLASYYSGQHHTNWLNGTNIAALLATGEEAGNIFGLFIPDGDVQVSGRPEQGGLVGESLEIVATESQTLPGDVYLVFG